MDDLATSSFVGLKGVQEMVETSIEPLTPPIVGRVVGSCCALNCIQFEEVKDQSYNSISVLV